MKRALLWFLWLVPGCAGDTDPVDEAATWSSRGKIFVFGSYRCDEVIKGGSFDTATRTWSALPSLPPSAWRGRVALIWGGIHRDGQRSNNGAAFR